MTPLSSADATMPRLRIHAEVKISASPRLTFCDFSTFYAPTAGGIRTYHDAKIAWFAGQQRHRYVLIYPGAKFSVTRLAPTVTLVTTYGPRVRAGYRLPLDIRAVRGVVRDLHPDVLEAGDPWFSGPFGLLFKRQGHVRAVASFFHGDPLRAYVDPWVDRAVRLAGVRRRIGAQADRWFYDVQRLYDVTIASSASSERSLRGRGVERVMRVPFGVDPAFLEVGRARRVRSTWGRWGGARLLYAGRLQADKGVDVLIRSIPRLLARPGVTLTIAGSGPYAEAVARVRDPRVRYVGYVADRADLAQLYARHDILLAPGPYETFGLSALEGIAAGLIVVAPDAGGSGELIRQLESPCAFHRGDADDFVSAVHNAMDGDRAVRSANGVAVAQRYGTWRDAVAGQVEAYCEYLSRCTT